MNLIYYHPIALKQKHPFQKVINPLISVLDRTKNKWPNFNYLNLFPMPKLMEQQVDFEKISKERIFELVNNQQHINVLWSGGIDSTYIMTLMIEYGLLDELQKANRLTIGLNQDSIRENPVFYENFIKKKYINNVVQADLILKNPKDNEVIITGEMADNLVGSLTMKSCVDYYNDFSVVHKPYEHAVKWMTRNLDQAETSKLREFIDLQVVNSPVELKTCHDLLWYLNFNLKWQAVNFRIVSHCYDNHNGNLLIKNLKHFFNTEDFQQWSMQQGHYFEGSGWKDYKMVMKKQIFRVTKDSEYYANKTKHPSLPGLLRYKDTFDFIYFDNQSKEYTFTKHSMDGI